MRSILNVWFILWLSRVIAILTVAVYGSTSAPDKKSDTTIIVSMNQDSHNTEKAIKSLEATLEKNCQKLIRVINATSGENPNNESSIKLFFLFDFISRFFFDY